MSIEKRKIGITIGDFNGVGPELIIKLCSHPKLTDLFTIVIYGSSRIIYFYRKLLNYNEFQYHRANNIEQVNPKKINVLDLWTEEYRIEPGKPNVESGMCAVMALKAAVEDLKSNKISALVTAPLHKTTARSAQFNFIGHTEFIAESFNVKEYLMVLCNENLRVGIVTGHVPINQVSQLLITEKIYSKIKVFYQSLKNDFGIQRPRIAVLGLNPHAGENGLIGDEEKNSILPAINQCKERKWYVTGPFSADGFFGSGTYRKFDGILAMYHDQGLIPFKTLAFDDGVNFTAGLPVVRTSPDHGTGFSLAGKNIASENSLRAAFFMAMDIVKNREMVGETVNN